MKQSTAWPFGAALLVSLWLAGCGGSSSTPPSPRGDGALVAANAGDLASYMQAKARERQALRASPGGLPVLTSVGDGAAAPTVGGVAATTVPQSGTTVQEQGVDEDDLIKTDGSTLVTLAREAQLRDRQGLGARATACPACRRRARCARLDRPALRPAVLRRRAWPVPPVGAATRGGAQREPVPLYLRRLRRHGRLPCGATAARPTGVHEEQRLDRLAEHRHAGFAGSGRAHPHRRAPARQPAHRQRARARDAAFAATRGRGGSRRRAEQRARSADREDFRRRRAAAADTRQRRAGAFARRDRLPVAARQCVGRNRDHIDHRVRPGRARHPAHEPLLRRRQRGAVHVAHRPVPGNHALCLRPNPAGAGVLVPGVDRHPQVRD